MEILNVLALRFYSCHTDAVLLMGPFMNVLLNVKVNELERNPNLKHDIEISVCVLLSIRREK